MSEPDILSSFLYQNHEIKVEWYDLVGKDLPDIVWQQVYAIGELDGLVPVVQYADSDINNLPGGKTEDGESVEATITRELLEEINCRILSWRPLGYQRLTRPDSSVVYQLRVYAKLEKIGEFVSDPGGGVIGYTLVPLENLNERINYGEVGNHIVRLVQEIAHP